MLANQFVPVAMAGDPFCHHPSDFNCDQVVDGEDLAMLLGSWGDSGSGHDLDGDCSIGGGDLAMVLGDWGPVPEHEGIKDVIFEDRFLSLCLGAESIDAVVDGAIHFNPLTYEPDGFVNLTYAEGGYVALQYTSGSVVMMCGETKMLLDTSDENVLYVNGETIPVGAILDGLQTDYETHGTNVSAWSDESKIIGTQIIIQGDVDIRDNVIVIQNQAPPQGGGSGPGLACKAVCIAAAAHVVMMSAAICAGLCFLVTPVTVGLATVTCVTLASILCSGLIFAGGQATYELLLTYWGG